MKQTNTLDFRNQLKSWMDGTRKEPLKITRKTGEAFVMVTANEYEQMQLELAQLRGQYQGLLDAFQGRTQKYTQQTISDVFAEVRNRPKKTKAKAIG